MSDKSNDAMFLQEISEIKKALLRIEQKLESPASFKTSSNYSSPSLQRPRLSLEVSWNRSKRFPYKVSFSGLINTTCTVSQIRLVILAILIRDTQDRLSGGPGIAEPSEKAQSLAASLQIETNLEAIKAAWFRFETEFLYELDDPNSEYKLQLHESKKILSLKHKRENKYLNDFLIDITSADTRISEMFDTIVPSSPLARARTRKVLYVSGGPSGFDRLFLELFKHEYRVTEISLFFKPSIITYPDNLLSFMQASAEDIERRRVILQGFDDERCTFVEILNRQTLKEMITLTSNGKFVLYPPSVMQSHIEMHLKELMRMTSSYKNYRLTLTDAPLPFLLSLFKISSMPEPENFTIFFRQLILEHDPDVSCFVINDLPILLSVEEHVVGWVLSDPSTIDDRDGVIKELRDTLNHLRSNGPIKQSKM